MRQFGWYLKRARVMGGREILHRARQVIILVLLLVQHRFGIGIARRAGQTVHFTFCTARKPQLPALRFDLAALRCAAGRLLDGQTLVAGRLWQWNGSPDIWRSAPDTGRRWSMGFFGHIRYREGNPYGDVRQLWEPSRLQQLVGLAMLARTGSADEREQAVRVIEAQLKSWVDSNPPLSGPHYISSMECALRLMAACHALDMVRDHLKDARSWDALAQIVVVHAHLIERRLSVYSSTGNHTVAEAAGLVYAGSLFPELRGSERRLKKGVSLLAKLSQTQVLPDGGGVEQAPTYHLFNLHLFWLVAALLRHLGHSVPPTLADALARGARFVEALDTGDGSLATIGDSDSGHALSRFMRLPATGESMASAVQFPQSGYTIAPVAPGARLIFDHGPLGMPPSFGHGHADGLSLQLYASGAPVLIDPGTYTYTGDQAWRHFFRGTPAHNTVTVDDSDQARQEGSFLWSKPFTSRMITAELGEADRGRLLAEHDGYRERGIRHLRGIVWERDAWILVWDVLLGASEHDLALHWHLGAPPVQLGENSFTVTLAGRNWTLRCLGGAVSLHSAERHPPCGWRSPTYGVLDPGHTVRVHFRGVIPHTFETWVLLGAGEPSTETLAEHRNWMQDLTQ